MCRAGETENSFPAPIPTDDQPRSGGRSARFAPNPTLQFSPRMPTPLGGGVANETGSSEEFVGSLSQYGGWKPAKSTGFGYNEFAPEIALAQSRGRRCWFLRRRRRFSARRAVDGEGINTVSDGDGIATDIESGCPVKRSSALRGRNRARNSRATVRRGRVQPVARTSPRAFFLLVPHRIPCLCLPKSCRGEAPAKTTHEFSNRPFFSTG